MINKELIDIYYQLGRLSTEALEQKKYHNAFRYALTAYSIVPDSEQHMKDNALVLIWKICEGFVSLRSEGCTDRTRNENQESGACSFCGKREPQVKLVQGTDGVFICNSCVNNLYNDLKGLE